MEYGSKENEERSTLKDKIYSKITPFLMKYGDPILDYGGLIASFVAGISWGDYNHVIFNKEMQKARGYTNLYATTFGAVAPGIDYDLTNKLYKIKSPSRLVMIARPESLEGHAVAEYTAEQFGRNMFEVVWDYLL